MNTEAESQDEELCNIETSRHCLTNELLIPEKCWTSESPLVSSTRLCILCISICRDLIKLQHQRSAFESLRMSPTAMSVAALTTLKWVPANLFRATWGHHTPH